MDGIIKNLYVNGELLSALFEPVCSKYKLTMTELKVLLFLAKNKQYDTATEIVEGLKITKSHVSSSVRDLTERGYLQGGYEGNNHRTIHLRLCDASDEIIQEGSRVQEDFLSIVTDGFSDEEISLFRNFVSRINQNANEYLHGQDSPNTQTAGQ